MHEEVLTNIGLSKEEAQIYLSLLSKAPQSANQLAESTSVKRTYVYKIAEGLIKQGLLKQDIRGRTTVYSPSSPDYLMQLAEDNKQKAQKVEQSLESILPSLKEKYLQVETRPVVTYYEGVEGIKKVFEDIYAPKEDSVLGAVDLEISDQALPDYIINKLIPLRIKNKVFARTFLAKSSKAEQVKEKDKESLRESTLLEKKSYPLPAEIDVYDDKVALLSFKNGNFTGVLIQNKDIATSLKTIMKLAFEAKHKE